MGARIDAVSQPNSMVIERGLFDARVTHVRQAQVPYALSHKLWYLNLPLDSLARLPWPWLGYNRLAIASVRDRDYGRGSEPAVQWITSTLRSAEVDPADWTIRLVTLPRVAGLAFNPVSFWMCHDAEGQLRAVLAEVNSTFGERHCYLCRKPDGGVIGPRDRISARKLMYVSPFLPVDGCYQFRFHESADRLGIFISFVRGGRTILFASIVGRLLPLTAANVRARLWRQPLPAIRVLLLIHFHAVRLFIRGLRILPGVKAERPLVSFSQPFRKSTEDA